MKPHYAHMGQNHPGGGALAFVALLLLLLAAPNAFAGETYSCSLKVIQPHTRVPVEEVPPEPGDEILIEMVCNETISDFKPVVEITYRYKQDQEEPEPPDVRFRLKPGIKPARRVFVLTPRRGGLLAVRLTGGPFWPPEGEPLETDTRETALVELDVDPQGNTREFPPYTDVVGCLEVDEYFTQCALEVEQSEHLRWDDETRDRCQMWFHRRKECVDPRRGLLAEPLLIPVKSYGADLLIILVAFGLFLLADGVLIWLVVKRDRTTASQHSEDGKSAG